MGISICVGMTLQKRWFFSKPEGIESLFERIAEATRAHLAEKNLEDISYVVQDQGRLFIGVHPAEEDMVFSVQDSYLVCRAKTSSAGPGYHAFVVAFLEDLEKKCTLTWLWDDEKRGFGDETGYNKTRDFERLQDSMAHYFHALAEYLSTNGTHQRLSLPVDFRIESPAFAVSPMGPWERSFFTCVVEDPTLTYQNVEAFFPWWHKDMDALFWKNVGLVKMWTQIKWHPPFDANDATHKMLERTLKCFENARFLSKNDIVLPETEIEEMRFLLTRKDCPIPEKNRIGFYRLNNRTPLMGNWSILLPGYFYETLEDETTLLFSHIDKTVRSFTVKALENTSPALLDESEEDEILSVFTFEKSDCHGKASLIKAPASEGGYHILICHVTALGSFCTVIIAIDDEKDTDWAVETFKSIEPLSSPYSA